MSQSVPSPCVSICALDDRDICIGCFRTGSEISFWGSLASDLQSIARRGWEIVRNQLVDKPSYSDFITGFDNYDFGNYRRAPTAYAPLAACATEMGDKEIAQGLLEEYNRKNPGTLRDGIFFRRNASVNHHALECIARSGRVNGIKDCVEQGMPDAWLSGPVIEELNYPDVLVAKAVSDGQNLEAVFYPGKGAGTFGMTIGHLTPLAMYQCTGAAEERLQADDVGRLRLTITVDGRSPFSIEKAV